MASSQTTSKDSSAADDKGVKGSDEGRDYEKLTLLLLAEKGYEHSKDNAKFRNFSIGREIDLGRDVKFDDNVFRYTDGGTTKNFIFVQLKHIQRDHQIDSRDLSVEAARAKRGRGDGKSREFNLQKYFISYLSVREELKSATSEEYTNGQIKYVVIFTNVGLDTEELKSKGFSLEKAPDDIIKLFTSETKEPKDFHQLSNISTDLNEILMKSSDLHRVARELAQYVVWENHREKNIMKNDTSPMKHYHVPLAREVIQKSDQVQNKSSKKQTKNEIYCEAQFREEFLKNDETGSKQELLNAVFEAIRELDESKKSFSDDQLKNLLKGIKWKIVPNFWDIGEKEEINFPSEWKTVKEKDITDFLKSLVLIVNQPRVIELMTLIFSSVQDTVVDRHYNTALREIIHKLDNTGPELKEHMEKHLGIYKTTSFQEKWISGEKIEKFLDEQKQQIRVPFIVTAMTLLYENEIMQFGKFKESEKMEKCLDNFFRNSAKILCVNTSQTLLSSIKILQYLNSKKTYLAEDGRIYTNSGDLKSKGNRDSVASAFELERNFLLVIEYRHTVNEQDLEEFYKRLCSLLNAKPNKKIILIIHQDQHNNLLKKFKNDFQNKDNFMLEYDDIDIKYFEPKEDPLKKEVIIFQGQDKRVSLSDITGIDSWNSYIHSLSQGTNKEGVIDEMTLVKIFNNDEIEVGSKPAGTSSLEGAYAQMYEEINVKTLSTKLISQEHDNNTNGMYIISGITGSNKQDRTDKLIQYLGLNNKKEIIQDQLGDIGTEGKIQIADEPFKDRDFRRLCHNYPEKRIFWICIQCENNATKFMLQEIYNPKFYLKRKFKNIIIKEALSRLLIREDFHEIFIFHCNKQELYNSMQLNECDKKKFDDNCKMGKIKLFPEKADAEADFKKISKQNKTVHLLEFEWEKFVWCDSHGSLSLMQMYIEHRQSEISLIDEDKLISKIKDTKVVLFADDPGMGKTTTQIKMYETEIESSSIIKSHWVIGIKLKDHLEAVRDLELKKDGFDIASVVEFLSEIDLKLNNKLSKKLMAIALDKNKHFLKSVLLSFDGFDEILDDKVRILILRLLKFIKNETAAKIWISTRCHFKTSLEKELSTFATVFVPMNEPQKRQYISNYLQTRLFLTFNEMIFNHLFTFCNAERERKNVLIYTAAFLNEMKKTFKDKISRFIGIPLQLELMLESSTEHFKKWIENDDGNIPVFPYVGKDICEIYEHFIRRKYDVYFQKEGISESKKQERDIFFIDRYHKDFAQSKILEVNPNNTLENFQEIYLLAGVVRSRGSYLEFIHKTFEEFFAAKVLIDWIKEETEAKNQEYLLKVILMKPDYELVRNFMNHHLKKISEKATNDECQNKLNTSLKQYGNIAEKLLNEKRRPLIDEKGTSLHVAVEEGNQFIARFLMNCFRGRPAILKKYLFTTGEYREKNYGSKFKVTALKQACMRDDVEIVGVLLDAVEGISEGITSLQEFLKYLSGIQCSALDVAVLDSHNVKSLIKLLHKSNNKLEDITLTAEKALCEVYPHGKEEGIQFLLHRFKHEEFKHYLKQSLLHTSRSENVLCYARSTIVVEKLISAAKSMEDNNETLKNLLLPEESCLPLSCAVWRRNIDVVEKLLNVAKEIGDDNHILKQLLLIERYGDSALHDAIRLRDIDIIKLLLKTAIKLDIVTLEKLVFAVNENGMNAIQLAIQRNSETVFADFFKMHKDEYPNIWKKINDMFDKARFVKSHYGDKTKLIESIENSDCQAVKDILSNVKNSSVSPNESLRILLLAEDFKSRNTLYIACEEENSEIIKELLFYAMNVDDGGATLKELLTKACSSLRCLRSVKHGYTSEIKQIVDCFIFEAKNNKRMQEVNILKEFKEQFTEVRLNYFQRFVRRIRSSFRRIRI